MCAATTRIATVTLGKLKLRHIGLSAPASRSHCHPALLRCKKASKHHPVRLRDKRGVQRRETKRAGLSRDRARRGGAAKASGCGDALRKHVGGVRAKRSVSRASSQQLLSHRFLSPHAPASKSPVSFFFVCLFEKAKGVCWGASRS